MSLRSAFLGFTFLGLWGWKTVSGAEPPLPDENKAREILEATVQALGGDAYLEMRTLVRRGRASSFEGKRYTLLPFTEYLEFPREGSSGKLRIERGKRPENLWFLPWPDSDPLLLYVFDGNQGWALEGNLGIREMKPEEVKNIWTTQARDLRLLLRRLYRNPEAFLIYEGEDLVDKLPVHILKTLGEGEGAVFIYFNKGNYLPVRVEYKEKDFLTNKWFDVTDIYADYLWVDGVRVPRIFRREKRGVRVLEVFLDDMGDKLMAEVNPELSPDLFARASLEAFWKDVGGKGKDKERKEEEEREKKLKRRAEAPCSYEPKRFELPGDVDTPEELAEAKKKLKGWYESEEKAIQSSPADKDCKKSMRRWLEAAKDKYEQKIKERERKNSQKKAQAELLDSLPQSLGSFSAP